MAQYKPTSAPPPSMNEDQKGLAVLPSDGQAAERVAFGMKPATMTYSGTGRSGSNRLSDRLMPAGSREESLARTNFKGLGGTATLEQAASDPNFNQDGRFFQGAGLAMTPQGKAQFVDRTPTQFAGGAANAEDANARRMNALQKLAERTGGKIDPETLAFTGNPNLSSNEVASRLAAGGNEPTKLSPEQLAQNKSSFLARLGVRTQEAKATRAENQRQEAVARANAPSPLVQRLMGENPELALRAMALQQQGQLAQGQLGVQQGQLALQGREVDQRGQLAREQVAAAEAQLGRRLSHEEKMAMNAQNAAAEIQKNNPLIAIEKDKLAAAERGGNADREQQAALAGQADKTRREQIASGERLAGQQTQAKFLEAAAAQAMSDPDMPAEDKLKALFGIYSQMAMQQPQASNQATGQPAAPAAAQPAGQPAAQGVQPINPVVPTDSLERLRSLYPQNRKTFAGGNLTQRQFEEAQKLFETTGDPEAIRDKLRGWGLKDEHINVAINKVIPPNFLLQMTNFLGDVTGLGPGALGSRSADDPYGWKNLLSGRGAVLQTKK